MEWPWGLYLGGLEEESDPEVRYSCVEFLREFTGQDFGEDVMKWEAWLALHPLGRFQEEIQEKARRNVQELLQDDREL